MAADLVLRNLVGLPANRRAEPVRLIAIAGNRIIHAGGEDVFDSLVGPATRMLDCQGGLVIPGFNDAHCHPLAYALTLRSVDCSPPGVRRISDLQVRLRRAAENGGEGWLRASNLDMPTMAEKRPPTRWELDEAVAHRPVLLVDRTGQHCVLNSRGLEICGITAASDDAAGGRIHRDPATGQPTGVISGNDERVARAIPPPSPADVEAGLRQAGREYLSLGITSIQDTSWSNGLRHWAAMCRFRKSGLLATRLTLLPGVDAVAEFAGRGLHSGSGDEFLRLGAAKIALDESTGNPAPTQQEVTEAAFRAIEAGFQPAFHVSDMHMLRVSLAAVNALRRRGFAVSPRFEHCPLCPDDMIPAVAASGAVVVAQPNLFHMTGEQYRRHATAEQLRWISPFRSILDNGVPLAFGSDSPLTPSDPFGAIHTAVSRRVSDNLELGLRESLTVMEALQAYTAGGAKASSEIALKGVIAAGQLADLAVLDRNLLDEPLEVLPETQVQMTLVDGKVVWEG